MSGSLGFSGGLKRHGARGLPLALASRWRRGWRHQEASLILAARGWHEWRHQEASSTLAARWRHEWRRRGTSLILAAGTTGCQPIPGWPNAFNAGISPWSGGEGRRLASASVRMLVANAGDGSLASAGQIVFQTVFPESGQHPVAGWCLAGPRVGGSWARRHGLPEFPG